MRIKRPKAGEVVVFQEFGHACGVFYRKERLELFVLASGVSSVIVVWPHDRGLTREIPFYRLGERPD